MGASPLVLLAFAFALVAVALVCGCHAACAPGTEPSVAPAPGPCSTCAEGTYSADGLACVPCPVGSSCPTPGLEAPVPCEVGRFSSSTGSRSCEYCPEGTAQPLAGQASCTDCAPGQAALNIGSALCGRCVPGSVAPEPRARMCVACAPGTAQARAGETACESCQAGSAASLVGSSACALCAAGTVSAAANATACVPCLAGTSSASGASACVPCSAGRYAPSAGSLCQLCPFPLYAPSGSATECLACATGGAASPDGDRCVPAAGYMAVTITLDDATPESSDLDSGSSSGSSGANNTSQVVFVPCPRTDGCCYGGFCGPCTSADGERAYVGLLCERCAAGYYAVGSTSACRACPRSAPYVYVGAAAAIVLVSVLLVRTAKAGRLHFSSLGIALTFFQVTAVVTSFDLRWPPVVTDVFAALKLTALDVDVLAPDCLSASGFAYETKWLGKLLLPWVFAAVFAVIWAFERVWGALLRMEDRWRESIGRARARRFESRADVRVAGRSAVSSREALNTNAMYRRACVNAMFALLSIAYVLLLVTLLEVHECEDGRMAAAPEILCSSPRWARLRTGSYIGLGVYGVGIPLLFACVIVSARKSLHKPNTIALVGLLYRRYRTRAYLWELIVLARKFGITFAKFFSTAISTQIAIMLSVLVVALAANVFVGPYTDRANNYLETFSVAATIVILLMGSSMLYISRTTGEGVGNNTFHALQFWLGHAIVLVVIVFTLVVLCSVVIEIAHLRSMQLYGIVGAFATDNVRIGPNFTDSDVSVLSSSAYSTTTDGHFSLALLFTDPAAMCVDVRAIDVRQFSSRRQRALVARGNTLNGSASLLAPGHVVSIQHDSSCRVAYVDVLFERASQFRVQISGGLPVVPRGGLCCADRNRDGDDVWHPRRLLMDLRVDVTEAADREHAELPGQSIVAMEALRASQIVLIRPMTRLLRVGSHVDFAVQSAAPLLAHIGVRFISSGRVVLLRSVSVAQHQDAVAHSAAAEAAADWQSESGLRLRLFSGDVLLDETDDLALEAFFIRGALSQRNAVYEHSTRANATRLARYLASFERVALVSYTVAVPVPRAISLAESKGAALGHAHPATSGAALVGVARIAPPLPDEFLSDSADGSEASDAMRGILGESGSLDAVGSSSLSSSSSSLRSRSGFGAE